MNNEGKAEYVLLRNIHIIKEKKARGGRGGGTHERNSSSMAWALKNDTEETAEYNSHDGRRRPGEVPRKKLKALGLTKNAPRERE